ncbi:MAG: diguanylate cyclase [Gammaproteobacteria bacterium]|jgi:diguanylate cyclase (GGDEF)-like protein/PAS domain S-box-containing protein|nr:diguanylate cyclase [Gammaproteobacteria bacterium]
MTKTASQPVRAGNRELESIREQFRELHRLALAEHDSYPSLYADYLTTGLRLFDMEVGIVSQIKDDSYTVLAVQPFDAGYAAGDVFPLGNTYCSMVVDAQETVAVRHCAIAPGVVSHPAYQTGPVGAYLAAPIFVTGKVHGTLNFTASTARPMPFSEEDVELVELMARSLGQALERDMLDRERALASQRVWENGELFESAFRYAAIGMALVGTDGRWLRVNRALTEMFGYTEAELLEIDFQSMTHPDDLDADMGHVRDVLDGRRDTYRMEKRYVHRMGHEVWSLLSVSLVRDDRGEPRYFVSQIQDITEQKRAQREVARKRRELERVNEQLQELAMVDPLTRVSNRRAFNLRLEAEIAQATRSGLPLSLLLVDVDHFKRFNDDFGHLAGDKALTRVAGALTDTGRSNDVVARYGGEEFALILPNTDIAGCRVVAERMREAIAAIASVERRLTASLGGATLVPRRDDQQRVPDGATLLRRADEALYAAKGAGRNRCKHFDQLA